MDQVLYEAFMYVFYSIQATLTKTSQVGDFYTTEIYFSQFWRLSSPTWRYWQSWWELTRWFIDRLSSHSSHGQRAESCLKPLYKNTNSIHEVPLSCPIPHPRHPTPIPAKAPPPNTIPLGIQFWCMNLWGGGTHIHSVIITQSILITPDEVGAIISILQMWRQRLRV